MNAVLPTTDRRGHRRADRPPRGPRAGRRHRPDGRRERRLDRRCPSVVALSEVDDLRGCGATATTSSSGRMTDLHADAHRRDRRGRSRAGPGGPHRRLAADPQRRDRSAATSPPRRRPGDTLPVLVALDAAVELVGPDGRRSMPVADFLVGPKRSALGGRRADRVGPDPGRRRPQQYRKVGVRNAMVIAVASLALVVDRHGGHRACRARFGRPGSAAGARGRGVRGVGGRLVHGHARRSRRRRPLRRARGRGGPADRRPPQHGLVPPPRRRRPRPAGARHLLPRPTEEAAA